MKKTYTTGKGNQASGMRRLISGLAACFSIVLMGIFCNGGLQAQTTVSNSPSDTRETASVQAAQSGANGAEVTKWESIPSEKQAYIKAHPSDYTISPEGNVTLKGANASGKVCTLTTEEYNNLSAEKKAYIKSHSSEYLIQEKR